MELLGRELIRGQMVLGLKGTISERKWHTIRKRLRDAAMDKARPGVGEPTSRGL